jgi:hypothetical protein
MEETANWVWPKSIAGGGEDDAAGSDSVVRSTGNVSTAVTEGRVSGERAGGGRWDAREGVKGRTRGKGRNVGSESEAR